MKKDDVEESWSHKKVLSPSSVVRVQFSEDVLNVIRRELNREPPARLDIADVFKAVRDVLSKEALADAGDLSIRKKRKRRRKVERKDEATERGRVAVRIGLRPIAHATCGSVDEPGILLRIPEALAPAPLCQRE